MFPDFLANFRINILYKITLYFIFFKLFDGAYSL